LEAEASIETEQDNITGIHQQPIFFVYSHHLAIKIDEMPSSLITAFKSVATFANPKFFELQRMRFSTWNTPSYICCPSCLMTVQHAIAPGSLSQCMELAQLAGATWNSQTCVRIPNRISVDFTGTLLPPHSETALNDVLSSESGGARCPSPAQARP
jgi:hypothetical protein